MTSAAAGKLEVVVTNETAAVWMAINNCVPGWPSGQIPSGDYPDRYWNGFICKIPKYYKSFTTGTNVQNLGSIKIITASGDTLVDDSDLAAGQWVQVVVAKSGRSSDPMPVNLAWVTLQGTFHKHVDPYDGGLLLWDGREPFNLVGKLGAGSNYWSEYIFTFMTGAGFEVAIYKQDDPASKEVVADVERIEIHSGIGGPGNPIFNPPQY
jgi:hypothetical protein